MLLRAALAAALTVACSDAVPSTDTGASDPQVDAVIRGACAGYKVECHVLTHPACEGGDGWGYILDRRVVCVNEGRCSADKALCVFVLLHEICHAYGVGDGPYHPDTCCCAASLASAEQNDAAEGYLCGAASGRCDAVRECR